VQYFEKNPQHSTLLLRRANEMRLSGTLCDTIIEVESHVFQVHSLVLACTSKKLETLLKDKGHRCTLDFLSWKTFQQILDYAYTEALEARVEDLKSLLEAAECLQMEQLGNQCLFLLTSLQKTEPQSKENGSLHREVPQSVQDSFIMNTTASLSSSDNGDQLTDDVTETKKCLMENGESLQTDGHADMSSSPEEKMELQHCQEKQNIQLPSRRPLTIDRQDIEGQRSLTFTDKQTTAARGRNKIPLICLLCGKHLESQLEMKEHLMLHTRKHMYECEFCNRCFRDDSSLKNHKRFHTGEKPYECSNCAKKFSLKHQLDTHYRVHTGKMMELFVTRCSVSAYCGYLCKELLLMFTLNTRMGKTM
uniref:Uncharacterized protein n=1 Tax=Erpetoichthys calabaricus TaxID=27687 RepID=A0A8C4XF23_ERPCA